MSGEHRTSIGSEWDRTLQHRRTHSMMTAQHGLRHVDRGSYKNSQNTDQTAQSHRDF